MTKPKKKAKTPKDKKAGCGLMNPPSDEEIARILKQMDNGLFK